MIILKSQPNYRNVHCETISTPHTNDLCSKPPASPRFVFKRMVVSSYVENQRYLFWTKFRTTTCQHTTSLVNIRASEQLYSRSIFNREISVRHFCSSWSGSMFDLMNPKHCFTSGKSLISIVLCTNAQNLLYVIVDRPRTH